MQLTMEFKFAAAHRLPHYQGPCSTMHGHNYRLVVSLGGKVDPRTGMVVDFDVLRGVVQEQVLHQCDHKCFNDLMENPTAENIAVWAWEQLKPRLAALFEVRLSEIDEAWVVYRGPDGP